MDLKNYKNVTILNHPLLIHKITMLRKVETKTNDFRRIVKEISILEGYEALKNLPTHEEAIVTPVEPTVQPVVDVSKLCFVPILRAGLGMVDGFVELVPNARVGHLGFYRSKETHKPVEYYCKLPNNIADKEVFLLDPMFATGGSAIAAIDLLKEKGAKKITFVAILAAPEGIKNFCEKYPDIPVIIGCVDRCLNEKAYICPGLGDAGDRIFGTVKD